MPVLPALAILAVLLVPGQGASLDGRPLRAIRIEPAVRPETDAIIRQHLASREGSPFHRATLDEDRRRLDALRLFTTVELSATPEGDGVVLTIAAKETLRLLPFLALSVTDENGTSAGPGFRGINVLGHGLQSSGTLQFGGATAAGVRLERPTVTPGLWDLDAKLQYRSRRNELFDFDETSTTVSTAAAWNWTSRIQAGGRAELAWYDTGSADVALSDDGGDFLPLLAGTLTFNSLDSPSNPHAGWYGSFEAGRQFGDASSWNLTLDGRRFQPIGERSTLSVVGFAAWQSGVVGTDLPEYMQFGLGGTNSVRGWALGSRIGRNQAIGSIEYNYAVVPVRAFSVFGVNLYAGLQAAAFSDVGMAWSEKPSASEAIDGYGVGVRVLFPFIDVLRLDLVFGEPGRGARFAFGINLKADKQRDRVR